METRLRRQNLIALSVLFLLTILSLIFLAGLAHWRPAELVLLGIVVLVVCGAFLLALLHLAGVFPFRPSADEQLRDCREELEQARQHILNLTQETRRRADLLTTERDRAEFLRQSFAELALSLDPRQILDRILARATQIAGATGGSILLIDEALQPAEVFLAGIEGRVPVSLRTREVLSQGLAGWVVRNRRGDIIYDAGQDERWLAFPGDERAACSAVAVPLLGRRRVLGVIVLTHTLPFQFNESHLLLLEELARQAAICLENADLYTIAEEERHKLAAILAGTRDAVLVVDQAGRLLLVNPAAEQALGVQAAEVLGRPAREALDHPDLQRLLSQAVQAGTLSGGELTTADGRVRYVTLSPIQDVGWVAILTDITYLKELDQMKSDFVATVSHDLRSPLTTVRGFADLVPMLGPLTEEQHEALEKIRGAVTQMNDLIEDLLDLGKIEAGVDMPMTPCRMDRVVREAVDTLLPRATLKQHDLKLEVRGEIPPVQGNAGRLRQVVANLVDNAIKYTPAGGTIRVCVSRQDGQVLVSVRDNGYGIASKDQEMLFQKFYRVRTEQTKGIPGTGLGLAIVRSIVEQHGGRIWVESEPGRGSIFTFSLPTVETAAAQGEGHDARNL